MDILKEQLVDMKNVAELFKTYYDKLEYTKFSGSRPYETELILKHIKFVQTLNISIKDELFLESVKADLHTVLAFLDSIFKYYNTIKEGYLKLKEVYDIYANYDIESYTIYSSSFSSSAGSYIQGLLEAYENLVNVWDAFSSKSESGIIEQMFIDKIMTVIDVSSEKTLAHIKSIYDKTKNRLAMIDLYGGILRRILDTAEPALLQGGVQKYITNLIEELKDEILPVQARETSNRKPTIQTLIQRYRLIPDGPSRPLDKLIQDLCNIQIDGKLDATSNLKKVATMISKKRKYGFVIFAKITPQPIENNIWLLTDSMYLQRNKLMQPSSAGLNNIILQKSETIHKLDFSEVTKNVLKDGIYYVDNFGEKGENSFYYVLETLDGVTFRILYPWYISIFAKEKIYEIPAHMLPDFTDTKKSCPYPRIETYNKLLNNEILAHLQKPYIQTELQSKLEKKQIEIKWDVIRRKIARNMMEDYRELFDKTIATRDNILGLVLHPDIFSNALNYIIESSGIKSGANLEIYMSALGSLNNMRQNMKRDMEKIYKDTYQDKIWKLLESGGSKISTSIKIVDALEDVLMEMLENQISEKSNIFALIQQKALLLENISVAAVEVD